MATAVRLPWWEEGATVMGFHRSIAAAQEQVRMMEGDARRVLEARAFVSTVMVSCEAECIPTRILSAEEACRYLTSAFEVILHHCPPDQPLRPMHRRYFDSFSHEWSQNFYGPSAKSAFLSHLTQHLKALMFLCIYNCHKPLDVSLFKQAHHILMRGFKSAPHEPYMGSAFRDSPLQVNGAVLIHETAITANIKDMLHRLHGTEDENNAGSDEDDNNFSRHGFLPPRTVFNFPERCATLLHDMAHIQPFKVGHEWLCRLIMAHFMVFHDRFAFPVPIAPITNRSSEEFLRCLSASDNDHLCLHEDLASGFRREKALLSAYILECVSESLEELIS